MCANTGGSCGAVDSKTLKKWVWPFIDGLAELPYKVVSNLCLLYSIFVPVTDIFLPFSDFISKIKNDHCSNCLLSIDGVDFKIQIIVGNIIHTGSQEVV